MTNIARTSATGDAGMNPELLAWSSSLAFDRQLVREDLVGSAAHVTMLARTGLVSADDAKRMRDLLLGMFKEAEQGKLQLPDGEEDVHMAVESLLHKRLGAVAARLHTARSRNDQVALDLRLHVRAQGVATVLETGALLRELCDRATKETSTLIPAYTHRQRAQPISAGFLVAAWANSILRSVELVGFTLARLDRSPLGSGACSGTSLPIDRALVARLLDFTMPSSNALDAVGDRDFALDWCWGAARILLALSRVATDVIDFASNEFGLIKLDGSIAAGSSMMPQKRNPDVFELVRGQASRGVANVTGLMTLMKGLPTGYNRDLQEDRRSILESGPLVRGAVHAMRVAMPGVEFDAGRGMSALADGVTQATDLAEALVKKGVPFRDAYKAVGALVKKANDEQNWLSAIDAETAKKIDARFDDAALGVLDPVTAVASKEHTGGAGPKAVAAHVQAMRERLDQIVGIASTVPSLSVLAERIAAEPLTEKK